jgi:hypothetical protein
MKITPHITEDDTIRIVRIVIKCADLLPDYDILEGYMIDKNSKFIRHEVKAPFKLLGSYIEKFSDAFLTSFVQADEVIQMEIQAIFNDFSSKIFILNEETTAMTMLYAKCKSICDDINEMYYTDKKLQLLQKHCLDFTKVIEKKFPLTLCKKDSNGCSIEDVAEALTKLGKTIMYSSKDSENV